MIKSLTEKKYNSFSTVLLVFNSATGRPGRLGTVLRKYGYEFDIRRPGEGDALPDDLSGYHLVGCRVWRPDECQ